MLEVPVAGLATAAGTHAGNERWQIPICLKAPGHPVPTCDLLTDESKTVTIGGACVAWVFANVGAKGYFRSAYSSDLLRTLSTRVAWAYQRQMPA